MRAPIVPGSPSVAPASFTAQPSAKYRARARMTLVQKDDPRHGPVRTLAEMSAAETQAIELRYGAKVRTR